MRRAIGFLTVGNLVLLAGLPLLAQDVPKSKVAKDDVALLTFGKVIEAVTQKRVDWKNPHQVTAHAVRMSCEGKTKQLIKEMGQVQDDAELGKALLTFIKDFGPDLERYKDKELHLKFHGYFLDRDTSIWYYWLTDKTGKNLEHSPWVSSRRSLRTQRCALTGIFLFDPDIKDSPGPMPKGLVTSLEKTSKMPNQAQHLTAAALRMLVFNGSSAAADELWR